MKRKPRLTNDSDVIVGKYFTSVYKFWSDGKFRSKYLYNSDGKLLNVFEYTYEGDDNGNISKYF